MNHTVNVTLEKIKYSSQTVNLLAGKWRMIILLKIKNGTARPASLMKEIPSLSRKVLHSEINDLLKQNLIYKEQIKKSRIPWVEYRLTPQGEKLFEAIILLEEWGVNNIPFFENSPSTNGVELG